MVRTINRSEVVDDDLKAILKKEAHHDHELIMDEHGRIRWKKSLAVDGLLKNISLNDLVPLLHSLGYGKNSEVYRKLYRCMGYSLYGYWEIFYWELNNPEADEYVPNKAP